MPKIITRYDPKPIPDRRFDWEARYANSDPENGARGFGATEAAAEAELAKEFPWDGVE